MRSLRTDYQTLVGHSVGVGIVGVGRVFQILTDTESVAYRVSRPTEELSEPTEESVGWSVLGQTDRVRTLIEGHFGASVFCCILRETVRGVRDDFLCLMWTLRALSDESHLLAGNGGGVIIEGQNGVWRCAGL